MKRTDIYQNETNPIELKSKWNETKRNIPKRNYQNIFEIIKGIWLYEYVFICVCKVYSWLHIKFSDSSSTYKMWHW